MNLNYFLSPIYLAFLMSGFACLLCLASLWWVKRVIQDVPRPPATDPIPQTALSDLSRQIGEMTLRLDEVEQRSGPLLDWATGESPSLNLNRRGQVLRLYRRGDSVAHIASALGLSTGEVALIVKVQEMIPRGRNQQNQASEL